MQPGSLCSTALFMCVDTRSKDIDIVSSLDYGRAHCGLALDVVIIRRALICSTGMGLCLAAWWVWQSRCFVLTGWVMNEVDT